MKENPPRRRWFRFSLRTMLVLVTLVCVYLGWAMDWRRQREAAWMISTKGQMRNLGPGEYHIAGGSQPPFQLRLFGVKGANSIYMNRSATNDEKQKLRVLFPEARIVIYLGESLSPPTSPSSPLTNDSGLSGATED
jgi:hypothetical protein